MLSLSVYEPIAIHMLLVRPSPNFGEWVELGGRLWYPVKLLHIRYNLFAETEMLSVSVYKPITKQILLGGTVPQFRGGGRVWYHVKLLHIRYNLFAGTEMLSLSVYELIAIKMLLGGHSPPIWGRRSS